MRTWMHSNAVYLLLVILCFMLPYGGRAAPGQLDSLMALLPGKEGIARARILNDIQEHIRYDKPENARTYAEEALQLSEAAGDKAEAARARYNLGSLYYVQGEFNTAMKHLRTGLSLRPGGGDDMTTAQSMNVIGMIHDELGTRDSALVYYFKALPLFEKADYKRGISTTLSNIGLAQYALGKHAEAIDYLGRSLAIDEALGNQVDIGYSLSNMGMVYSKMEQNDLAIEYHKRALELRRNLGNKLQLSRSLNNLAHVYQNTGERDEAARYFLEALEIKRKLGNGYEVAITLNNLGELYTMMGRYRDALVYHREALSITDTLQAMPLADQSYRGLSDAFAGLGDYEQAYKYTQLHLKINDSLRTVRSQKIEAELMAKYNSMQQEKEIEGLRAAGAESDLQTIRLRTRLYVVIGGLVIAILLTILILSRFLSKRRSNLRLVALNRQLEDSNQEIARKNDEINKQSELLSTKNEEILQINSQLENIVDERTQRLRRTNQELDTFLYQSSHALRGPLMRIMGLFSIIKTEENATVVEMMNEKIDYTIRHMDRMLHKLVDVTEIKIRDLQAEAVNLHEMVREQIAAIETEMRYPECTQNIRVPDTPVQVPDRYLMTIVLRNIIENALHFRMPGRKEGHVVDLDIEAEGDQLAIRIRDNGMGVAEAQLPQIFNMFHRATEKSAGTGLGLYVVKKVLELVDGKADVESVEGEYTVLTLRIPIPTATTIDLEKVEEKVS